MINRNNFTYEEELNNCNFVKLMLMLLVTLYHSSVFWGEKWLDLKPIYSSLSGTMVFFHPEIRRKRLPYAETSLVAKNIFPS